MYIYSRRKHPHLLARSPHFSHRSQRAINGARCGSLATCEEKTVSNTAEGWIDFQALKASATVGVVIAHFGLNLKPEGDEWKGGCPFHEESGKDSSFSFNETKKAFHCFACKRKGSILDFVQQWIAFKEKRACGIKEAGLLLAQAIEAEKAKPQPVAIPASEIREASAVGGLDVSGVFFGFGEASRAMVKGADSGEWVAVRVSAMREVFGRLHEALNALQETMETKAQEPHTPARKAKK